MAEAMRAATPGPLLFKIRAEEDRARLLEFVQMLESAGADAIVVHGRTAREKLCRPAHWEPIAAVAAARAHPRHRQRRRALGRRTRSGCSPKPAAAAS